MPRILVTNDDGVHSEGIRILADALMPLGDVIVGALGMPIGVYLDKRLKIESTPPPPSG